MKNVQIKHQETRLTKIIDFKHISKQIYMNDLNRSESDPFYLLYFDCIYYY